jgi:predicted HAD superfamily Cof-like phosphohydrolase
MVRTFHARFGLPTAAAPLLSLPAGLTSDRLALLQEEVRELEAACRDVDATAVADALADIVYVAYGTALAFGIDLDRVLATVHRSNMKKRWPDGKTVLGEHGKVEKPPGWRRPDVARAAAGGRSRKDG